MKQKPERNCSTQLRLQHNLGAIAFDQVHKDIKLLLINEHRSIANEADSLVQLATIFTAWITIYCTVFSDKLNALTTNTFRGIFLLTDQ